LKITGCSDIDVLIKPGSATLFYGEAGVGKTNLLLTIAANICSPPSRCLYISTEDILFYEIVARNAERYEEVLFTHIRELDELLNLAILSIQFVRLKALFIDSINAPYRLIAYREDSITRYGLLLASIMSKVVRDKMFFFASAQVRARYHEDEEEIVASGMPILEFWFNNIFRVSIDEKGRFVELKKPTQAQSLKKYFTITSRGVVWIDH